MPPPLTRSILRRRTNSQPPRSRINVNDFILALPEIGVVVSEYCQGPTPASQRPGAPERNREAHSNGRIAVSDTNQPEEREVPSNGSIDEDGSIRPAQRAFNPMAPPPVPPEKQLTLADRSRYAKQIFYFKTNARCVAREEVLVRYPNNPQQDRLIRRCRRLLYKNYANEPKMRLMSPLHKIRFVSRYYEYRFELALKKSFANEGEYQRYIDVAMAGGARECFVDMTQNNVLLQDQGRLMAKLRREFSNWSSKVENLPKYLMAVQRKRQANRANAKKPQKDPELLDALLHHSNTTLPEMRIRKMFRNIQGDKDPATNLTWMFGRKIEFDSDELNRQFRVGPYLTEPTEENAEKDETERHVPENLGASDGLQIEPLASLPDIQDVDLQSSSPRINLDSLTDPIRSEYVEEPLEPRCDTPVPIPGPSNVSAPSRSASASLNSSTDTTGYVSDSPSETTVIHILNGFDSDVSELDGSVASLDSSPDSTGFVSDSPSVTTVTQILNAFDSDISEWVGAVEEVPFIPVVIDLTEDCTPPEEPQD